MQLSAVPTAAVHIGPPDVVSQSGWQVPSRLSHADRYDNCCSATYYVLTSLDEWNQNTGWMELRTQECQEAE